jgi:hypothetical protein
MMARKPSVANYPHSLGCEWNLAACLGLERKRLSENHDPPATTESVPWAKTKTRAGRFFSAVTRNQMLGHSLIAGKTKTGVGKSRCKNKTAAEKIGRDNRCYSAREAQQDSQIRSWRLR